MFYTDDLVHDFEMHDLKQQEMLERLPDCSECGQPIQQEMAVYINGEWLCDSCLDSYRRPVSDY